jgi:hypothetical protein
MEKITKSELRFLEVFNREICDGLDIYFRFEKFSLQRILFLRFRKKRAHETVKTDVKSAEAILESWSPERTILFSLPIPYFYDMNTTQNENRQVQWDGCQHCTI